MLQNFIIALKAVAPMFIIMAIGILLRRNNFMNETEVKKLNKLVFNVFFPCLMFNNIYGAEIGEAFDLKFITFTVIMILVMFFTTMAVIVKIEPSDKSRGAMIQAIYRSNFVLFGLPLSYALGGETAASVTSVLICIVVPVFNFLAVITLETFRGGKTNILKMFLFKINDLPRRTFGLAPRCGDDSTPR